MSKLSKELSVIMRPTALYFLLQCTVVWYTYVLCTYRRFYICIHIHTCSHLSRARSGCDRLRIGGWLEVGVLEGTGGRVAQGARFLGFAPGFLLMTRIRAGRPADTATSTTVRTRESSSYYVIMETSCCPSLRIS